MMYGNGRLGGEMAAPTFPIRISGVRVLMSPSQKRSMGMRRKDSLTKPSSSTRRRESSSNYPSIEVRRPK